MNLALEYDITTGRSVLFRSYTRPQLWMIRLWICGEQPGVEQTVEESTELRPHERLHIGDMRDTALAELAKLAEPFSVIEGGGMMIYRRTA